MTLLQTIVIAIIEGLTEFLPISSTGHMILASTIMGVANDEFVKTFEVAIQFGAILAVVMLYHRRFLEGLETYKKLAIAFVPTGIFGFLLHKTIKTYLFNPYVVSAALIVGGVVLIVLDKWSSTEESKHKNLMDISYLDAIKIGLFQCISMIPGVSRAAATIFGGIFVGFSKKQAAEFSFLLAVPTMMAATGYDLLKQNAHMTSEQWQTLGIGCVIAFVSAVAAIKFFIALLTRTGFRIFGWYRIGLGIAFLAYAHVTGLTL
jgi:undecaprenyl-diphosphatase